MFMGHYSAALVGKGVEPRLPLWLLLVASQFVDFVWGVLVLLGVERVVIVPGLPSNPLELQYVPYSHSLLSTALWGGLVYALARRWPAGLDSPRAPLVLSLVVGTHWILDLIAHRPDLPLVSGPPKFGLALWDRPLLEYCVEMALLGGSVAFYIGSCRLSGPGHRAALGFGLGLGAVQTAVAFGPLPSSVAATAASELAVFVAVAWTGAWSEKLRRS